MEINENPKLDEYRLKPLQRELLRILKENGPMTRREMVLSLNKPRTTIYDNLVGLMEKNLVKKFSRQINSRGRPVVFFKLKEY